MDSNPNPARITDPLWWFVQACLAYRSGTTNGGTIVQKRGYHGTVQWNLDNIGDDYSVRDAIDRQGPWDKTRAFDWTFPDAQRGDYDTIIEVMDRFEAAFHARDPRTNGLREILGQADPDEYAEGFDFRYWYTRTPDASHLWHIHFSICTAFLLDWLFFRGLFSIVCGLTYQQWLAEEAGNMLIDGDNNDRQLLFRVSALVRGDDTVTAPPGFTLAVPGEANWLVRTVRQVAADLTALKAEWAGERTRDAATTAALDALRQQIAAGGGNVDVAAIIARINEVAQQAADREAATLAEVERLRMALAAAERAGAAMLDPGPTPTP